ncbi:hypothetical protein [Azospirillum sp. B506]|uniref:hypothetical protein n=1 Tax=Azospirillum sp. B506 TaxID=137721 RepID=UPI0018FF700B|nr:hypothetical protein [Azospirillum sp. B506]
MPKGLRLRGGEQTAASLVQARTQQGVLAAERGFINHQTEATGSDSRRESPTARPDHSIRLFWPNALWPPLAIVHKMFRNQDKKIVVSAVSPCP